MKFILLLVVTAWSDVIDASNMHVSLPVLCTTMQRTVEWYILLSIVYDVNDKNSMLYNK